MLIFFFTRKVAFVFVIDCKFNVRINVKKEHCLYGYISVRKHDGNVISINNIDTMTNKLITII